MKRRAPSSSRAVSEYVTSLFVPHFEGLPSKCSLSAIKAAISHVIVSKLPPEGTNSFENEVQSEHFSSDFCVNSCCTQSPDPGQTQRPKQIRSRGYTWKKRSEFLSACSARSQLSQGSQARFSKQDGLVRPHLTPCLRTPLHSLPL